MAQPSTGGAERAVVAAAASSTVQASSYSSTSSSTSTSTSTRAQIQVPKMPKIQLPKPLQRSLWSQNQSVSSKRLQHELDSLIKEPLLDCNAGPKGSNLYKWVACLRGPAGSPYEGGVFFLDLSFNNRFPFEPPKVVFRTKIYHCNINSKGKICLDVLGDAWSPILSVSKLLLSISALLAAPNADDPLVGDIAKLALTNPKLHDQKCREYTRRYAR